jgi:signal transduction histidine kinase
MSFLLLNHTIALFLTAATAFTVGAFVLFKSKGNKTNLAYAIWSLSVAVWSFFMALVIIADNLSEALFLTKIMWAFVLFISVSTAHFVTLFLGIKGKELFIRIGYILCAFFAVMSFTPYMAGVKEIGYLKYFPDANPLVYLQFFVFAIYVVYQIYQLFTAYRTSTSVRHNQIAYVLWASLLGYTGGISNYLLAFDIYIPIFHPFASYLLILYSVLVALAILKYQLMDIKVVIQKALIYSISIALISGLMVGVSFLSDLFVHNVPGFQFWVVPLLAGFVAFLIGNIFWRKSKEVDKLKYEFITVAAHKLRTPLTRIKWASSTLKDKNTSEEEKENLISEIMESDNQLIELTNELLQASKAESGQYHYKMETANLEKIARKIVNDYQVQVKEKNIKLIYNYEKNLPNVLVDKTRISSVINVLLENAIQYTKDEIKINIDVYKDNVIFHIEDNGIGILKEDQPYIFSRFFRTHEAYLSETKGTGIGLFLAKSIIEKHNGKIGLRSEGKGKGSTFWFGLKAV